MSSRSREIYKPQRLADIIALSPYLGFDALQLWFDSQPPTPGAAARTKLILGPDGEDAEYSAIMSHPRTARVRTTSLTLTPVGLPYTKIKLKGRQQAESVEPLIPTFVDCKWADDPLLRWRRSDGVLDFVSINTWVGEGFEPPIITVATPNFASVEQAEEIFFNAARLLTAPRPQAPEAAF